MITIGEVYRGPELKDSAIHKLLSAMSRAVSKIRGPWIGDDDFGPCGTRPASGPFFEKGSAPAINVIFHVPGSLSESDVPREIGPARFSRKQKLLLIEVPVPREVVAAGGSVDFVVDTLHEANRIAAETFSRKGTEPFDLENADEIVEKVRQSLLDQGF